MKNYFTLWRQQLKQQNRWKILIDKGLNAVQQLELLELKDYKLIRKAITKQKFCDQAVLALAKFPIDKYRAENYCGNPKITKWHNTLSAAYYRQWGFSIPVHEQLMRLYGGMISEVDFGFYLEAELEQFDFPKNEALYLYGLIYGLGNEKIIRFFRERKRYEKEYEKFVSKLQHEDPELLKLLQSGSVQESIMLYGEKSFEWQYNSYGLACSKTLAEIIQDVDKITPSVALQKEILHLSHVTLEELTKDFLIKTESFYWLVFNEKIVLRQLCHKQIAS